MDNNLKIIQNNFVGTNESFLEELHEKDYFNIDKLDTLCEAIASLTPKESFDIAYKIHFIYSQTLKHIIYHFDTGDLSSIKNLPSDYMQDIERLDSAVEKFFK